MNRNKRRGFSEQPVCQTQNILTTGLPEPASAQRWLGVIGRNDRLFEVIATHFYDPVQYKRYNDFKYIIRKCIIHATCDKNPKHFIYPTMR